MTRTNKMILAVSLPEVFLFFCVAMGGFVGGVAMSALVAAIFGIVKAIAES